jgi:hypothetical protein
MKLKVYILKKQQLIWAAIILAILLISAAVIISLRTNQTISILNSENTIQADIDGNGKTDDSVIFKADEITGEYSVSVITSDGKEHILASDPVIKTLGYYKSYWPVNVFVDDINKNGDTEIVLQSSDKAGPILHIFKYADGQIERLASGRYSFFGTVRPPVEKNDIIILGNKKSNGVSLTYLKTKDGHLLPYAPSSSLTLGKDTFASLVKYMEKEDIEAASIDIENKVLSKLPLGKFLDCSLTDIKYTKYDIPSECTYILRASIEANQESATEFYKIKLTLSNYNELAPEYKISGISKIKNK